MIQTYRNPGLDPKDIEINKLRKQLNKRKSILKFVLKFLKIFFRTRMMRAKPIIKTEIREIPKWYSIETANKVKAWDTPHGYAGYYTCPRFGKLVTCYSRNGIDWYYADSHSKIGHLFGEQQIITTLQQIIAKQNKQIRKEGPLLVLE